MRRYQDALTFLNQHLDLERRLADQFSPSAMDPDRPARLLNRLGDPHDRYPSLHIAGTKGKGSTAALCAARLATAGYRVGLHTSPHLQDVRERFRIWQGDDRDGRIDRATFADLVDELRPAAAGQPELTWFELTTALAFLYFAAAGVDVAVVEVGLGGRLDATNVLTPLVSVITRISLDHTALLGHTLAAIAGEKGGIIKPGVPAVTAPQVPAAAARLAAIAAEKGSPLIMVGQEWRYQARLRRERPLPYQQVVLTAAPPGALSPAGTTFELGLLGAFQAENAVTALAALSVVADRLPRLRAGQASGWATLQWAGRLQQLPAGNDAPTLIVDGAHNPDAAAALRAALSDIYAFERLYLVVGCHRDKDVTGLLAALVPGASHLFCTAAASPRALPATDLQQRAAPYDIPTTAHADIPAAMEAALAQAGPADLICVTGSLYVVGELLNWWDSLKSATYEPRG